MVENNSEQMVTVYTTSNPAMVAVVQSLLDDAGIRFFMRGEELGRLYLTAIVPTVFQVAESDADEATELLKDVTES